MASDEPRRKYAWGMLDDEVWQALHRAATKSGIHPSDIVEQAIVAWLKTEGADDPNTRIFLMVEAARDQDRKLANLKNLVWRAMKEQNEDAMDSVRTTCEENQIDFDTLLTEVQESKQAPMAYTNERGVKSAIAWLTMQMQVGQQYLATEMLKMSQANGYNTSTINNAKRELGIRSIRCKDAWYWVLEP